MSSETRVRLPAAGTRARGWTRELQGIDPKETLNRSRGLTAAASCARRSASVHATQRPGARTLGGRVPFRPLSPDPSPTRRGMVRGPLSGPAAAWSEQDGWSVWCPPPPAAQGLGSHVPTSGCGRLSSKAGDATGGSGHSLRGPRGAADLPTPGAGGSRLRNALEQRHLREAAGARPRDGDTHESDLCERRWRQSARTGSGPTRVQKRPARTRGPRPGLAVTVAPPPGSL